MKKLVSLTVLTVVLVSLSACNFGAAIQALNSTPTPTEVPCNFLAYEAVVKPLAYNFGQDFQTTTNTVRMNMSGGILAMTQDERAAKTVDVPSCLQGAHPHLIAAMDWDLQAAQDFMGSIPDSTVTAEMNKAYDEMKLFNAALNQIDPSWHGFDGTFYPNNSQGG